MRIFSISLLAAAMLAGWLPAAQAEEAESVAIPDKARASILKRHPQAQDLQASRESHFGQELLEIRFKDADDQIQHQLFRTNGAFFSKELTQSHGFGISPDATKVLNDNFPGHRIEKSEVVVNPNGAGEEYELYLVTTGGKWKVTMDDKGKISAKDRY